MCEENNKELPTQEEKEEEQEAEKEEDALWPGFESRKLLEGEGHHGSDNSTG